MWRLAEELGALPDRVDDVVEFVALKGERMSRPAGLWSRPRPAAVSCRRDEAIPDQLSRSKFPSLTRWMERDAHGGGFVGQRPGCAIFRSQTH